MQREKFYFTLFLNKPPYIPLNRGILWKRFFSMIPPWQGRVRVGLFMITKKQRQQNSKKQDLCNTINSCFYRRFFYAYQSFLLS
jgi:hypothetical protein